MEGITTLFKAMIPGEDQTVVVDGEPVTKKKVSGLGFLAIGCYIVIGAGLGSLF